MAAFTKFQDFVEQLGKGIHQLHAAGHTLKVMLTNETPLAGDTIKGDMVEITAQNGYPAGGTDIQNDLSETGGTLTVTAQDVVFTASGGSFGPFRYAVVYNDSVASPVKPLVCWWDYGSSISCLDGETFTVDFGVSLFTLA
jgi:hypothetical protein